MNPGTGFGIAPAPRRGGGFGVSPQFIHYSTGHDALAWATFALVLLLVLTVYALVIARFARRSQRRRGFGGPGHRRRFGFAGPGPGMGPGRGMGPAPDPLDVLRWRYARGEIGRDEFLLATSDLTAHGEATPPPPS
jgi:hypothetical protein